MAKKPSPTKEDVIIQPVKANRQTFIEASQAIEEILQTLGMQRLNILEFLRESLNDQAVFADFGEDSLETFHNSIEDVKEVENALNHVIDLIEDTLQKDIYIQTKHWKPTK